MIIEPQYDLVYSFSNGRTIVKKDGLAGIIDENGAEILPPSYSYISSYGDNGKAVFRADNDKWGFLDENGQIAIEPVYDYAAVFDSVPLALVQKDGMCGAVDENGDTVIDIVYQNIGIFTRYTEE